MITREEFARGELAKDLQSKLDTFIHLAEVSKRAIKMEEQLIANYEAQISVLRESLRNLKSPHVRKAQTMTAQEAAQKARMGGLLNLLQKLQSRLEA